MPYADTAFGTNVTDRSRRIRQLAALGAAAFALMACYYYGRVAAHTTALHVLGALLMGASLYLDLVNRAQLASFMLWTSSTVVVSAIIWAGAGIEDVGVLAYPVLMMGAGLFLNARNFLLLCAAVLTYVVFLGAQSVTGQETLDATLRDHITDVVVTLSVGALMIWLFSSDVRRRERALEDQIASFHKTEQDLLFHGRHDPLTGLPNRNLGAQLIEREMATAQRNGKTVAVLFVDLDNFKDVNDSLGQQAGDRFLWEFSQRLASSVRKTDVVCRHGGDEFLVGLTHIGDDEDVSRSAQKVLNAMNETFNTGGIKFLASCSIGAAVFPRDGQKFEELMRHAELAMRQAKDAGRNTVKFFNEEIDTHITENLHLVSMMRNALQQKEFVLHYQPIYDLSSGDFVGAEALVRWNSPAMGLVSPGLFIPLAERSGLIVEIGQWVLQEACRQLRVWQDQGATQMRLAVNLSPVQFKRGNVESVVEHALRISGIDPGSLELEVTESTLIQDTEKFIQSLQNLKKLGVRISIDDFGTGYSNLSYLQRFEVDKLKIDQSFVKRLLGSSQDRAIVSAIIQMSRSLKLVTQAEGVEDAATLQVLRDLGCDFAQGYYFARPLPDLDLWKLWLGERMRLGYPIVSQADNSANASAFGPDASRYEVPY